MKWREEQDVFRCTECATETPRDDLIKFPDPEMAENYWTICPFCREAEQFERMCDAFNCDQTSSCGTPTPDGYRITCYEHKP